MRVVAFIEETVAKLLLLATVILVLIASLARWAGFPIIWSVDIAQVLFVWTIFLGAHQALRQDEHVGVDLLVRRLGDRTRTYLDLVLWTVVAAFLVLLIYHGTQLTLLNLERRLSDTQLSYAWVTAAVPVGCALLLMTVCLKLAAFVSQLAGRSPMQSRS
jgi:TRAP-type C4-dicarboxylate transport system permease small subunit